MGKIKLLPNSVISKIAAGEVIERPLFVVKELIENAIDANATQITVDLTQGGLERISITDNGEGMDKDDLNKSYLRHTTSKLNNEQELYTLQTLGFRGEALASISAVSHLTISSRQKDTPGGHSIEIIFGQTKQIKPIGMPEGTKVTVSHLFENIPGRKKFLKNQSSELRQVLDLMTHFAIIHPQIKWVLINNKKKIFDLSEQSQIERIGYFLTPEVAQFLIPINSQTPYLKLTGFIGSPQISGFHQQRQYIFVNNRLISDKAISTRIKQGYGNLLEPLMHPTFIIFMNMPTETVDVNVHPRKEEVAFTDPQSLLEIIEKTVKETLEQNNLHFQNMFWGKSKLSKNKTKTFTGNVLKDDLIQFGDLIKSKIKTNQGSQQFHNLYIVSETDKGIILIDQHAAHERVLYEKITTNFIQKKLFKESTKLSKPLLINLSLKLKYELEENISLFNSLGFEIEHFQNNSFKIIKIPKLFIDRDIEQIITELLEENIEQGKVKDIDYVTNKIITFIACRSAIKAGDKLTQQQIKELLKSLEECPNNQTCPHGRPTKIEIPLLQLNRMFKRS